MPVWIFTLTNATQGQLAFSATKDGDNQGSFTIPQNQIDKTNFNIYNSAVREDFAWGYNAPDQPDLPGESPSAGIIWFKEPDFGLQEFPTNGQGFIARDCIIILNATTDTTASLSVGTFFENNTLTIQSNASVSPGDMIFAVIPNNGFPQFTDKPCCVYPDTMVLTKDGLRMIKTLKKGDIVIDVDSKEVPLLCNAKGVTTKKFVNIPAGSIGSKVPSQDLLIREEHPILIEGKETTPRRLMKKDTGYQLSNIVLKKAEHVYTLCTKDRHFIMMNNLPVSSWSEESWENYNKSNPNMFWISQ